MLMVVEKYFWKKFGWCSDYVTEHGASLKRERNMVRCYENVSVMGWHGWGRVVYQLDRRSWVLSVSWFLRCNIWNFHNNATFHRELKQCLFTTLLSKPYISKNIFCVKFGKWLENFYMSYYYFQTTDEFAYFTILIEDLNL